MEILLGSRKRLIDQPECLPRQKRLRLFHRAEYSLCHNSQSQTLPNNNSNLTFDQSLNLFHQLIDNSEIPKCLGQDTCSRFSDKYLIAQTFIYFTRCRFRPEEYTQANFYLLLYLANDMEEDLDFKMEILPWCKGINWRNRFGEFQTEKENLWKRMDYKILVRHEDLEHLIRTQTHWVWRRERERYHSGAVRDCYRPSYEVNLDPKGKFGSPMRCDYCNVWKEKMTSSYHSDSDREDCNSSNRSRNILMSDSDSDSAYASNNSSLLNRS